MERTAVNPWDWSMSMGFNQGEVVTGQTGPCSAPGRRRWTLTALRSTAATWRSSSRLALDNLESVLEEAGMGLGNVVRLNIYTTDVDSLFEHYGVLAARTGAAQVSPPGTLLGVARLAYPELLVELEATAVA